MVSDNKLSNMTVQYVDTYIRGIGCIKSQLTTDYIVNILHAIYLLKKTFRTLIIRIFVKLFVIHNI